jgi:hypothetical protein
LVNQRAEFRSPVLEVASAARVEAMRSAATWWAERSENPRR